jgi:DMSO/TMAO reductase YedYZ molybdopterin-dependent catalytic subunit
MLKSGLMFHSLYNRSADILAPKNDPQDKHFLSWPASYMDGVAAFDPETWQLEVSGLVGRPMSFGMKDLMGFTRVQQNRRLVFADGWTYRASWEGIVLQELLHRVMPQPEAQYLIQTNLSGHRECVAIKDLLSQRALLCLRVAGKPLPALYGGPLRLMVFDRYAHKGLGQLSRIELSNSPVEGFFAKNKGYDPEGRIEPDNYYAADLQIVQAVRSSEEITQW